MKPDSKKTIQSNNLSSVAADAFTGGLRATENISLVLSPLRSKATGFALAAAFDNEPYWIYAMVNLKEITKRQAMEIFSRKEGSR